MNKILLIISALVLAACSSHSSVGQPQAPLDMQSVQVYNQKVNSGNTVPVEQRVQYDKPVDMPLNASDSRPKQSSRPTTPVILMPSVGYHYHYRHW